MTFVPSAAQQNFFDWITTGEGHAVVTAVAGAGKTTTIVEGLPLMTDAGPVFLGAYNTKMANELRTRVRSIPGVYASTFHSAGNKQLHYALGKKYALHTDRNKVSNIVDTFVARRPDLESISLVIPSIVSMAKQRGIGALVAAGDANDNTVWQQMIEHFALDDNLPDDARIDQVIAFARAVLKNSNEEKNVIDFDDMVYLPVLLKLKMFKNKWVLIDEAQDTNPIRRALAAMMLDRDGRLVAVGDPHQSIFGFTGADNDSLDLIKTQFEAKEIPLTVSYRCPKAVVTHARQWVNHIESHPDAPEGEVNTIEYVDLMSHVKTGDAVLCRYNKYLVSTCFQMIRAGIPAKIEGRLVGQGLIELATRWKSVKTLNQLDEKLEDHREKEIKKALAKGNEQKIDRINDMVETLLVLIKRARDIGYTSVVDLRRVIEGIFGDDVTGDDLVTLCSVHRSKGLEWRNVFLLDRPELMPSKNVTQQWALEQEYNLVYVAVTRAKECFYEVINMVEKKRA